MAKVYLSPSNHGVNQNKCLKAGCYEDKHTRPIAEACAKHLKAAGIEVKVAAASTSVNNGARTREANSFGADLYVPIHTNAASESARYLMLMFWEDSEPYRKIFNAVSPYLEAIYPGKLKTHFSVRKDLVEINNPEAKTMYCELGFHTNHTDVDEFIHNSDEVGKALADGICNYFGITAKEEKPQSKPSKPAKKPVTSKKTISSVYNSKKALTVTQAVKAGQAISNIILGTSIKEDGKWGSETKKNAVKILQWAMNKDYGVGLEIDGIAGTKTYSALGNHTVRRGETQYMVTALEVLLLMNGYNPHGVEIPGEFGDGCAKATGQYQEAKGLTVDKIAGRNTFLKLIS